MRKLIVSVALLLSLGCAASLYACSCLGSPSICSSYAGAKAVFIGSVRVVENQTAKMDDGSMVITRQKAYVQVEQTFKGSLAAEVIFRTYGTSCDPQYKEGQRWLFYGYYDEKDKAWQIGGCGRSTLIDDANDDLLYLQALPKSAGTTRISGTLKHYENDPEKGSSLVRNILGAKVTIIGGGKTYETYTDKNGVYEIYDIPPGSYAVRPEIPLGLIAHLPMVSGSPRKITSLPLIDALPKTGGPPDLRVELKEKSCVGVSFVFSADTKITGKVIGADGKILPRVCLRLQPADKKAGPFFFQFDCTRDDGSYSFDKIAPGDYLIVVNDDGKMSGDAPFPRVYYPGTVEKEKAIKVNVIAGVRLADYNINIPSQLPTRVLSGVLVTSDGQPLAGGLVKFEATEAPEGYQGVTQTRADAHGRFALNVLMGFKGSLRGFMYTFVGEYVNCPELDRLLKEKKGSQLETKPLLIEVNSDVEEIKLKFPFPHCVKDKIE